MRELPNSRQIKNWEEYYANNLFIERRKMYSAADYISCGSAALSLITGIHPATIEKSCPNPSVGWYTTRAMKYLKSKGYTAIQISKKNVLKSLAYDFPVGNNHCLLMNVRMDSNENSMYVFHKGILWHNFSPEYYFNELFFLNKPTQDVLLVFNKKWK